MSTRSSRGPSRPIYRSSSRPGLISSSPQDRSGPRADDASVARDAGDGRHPVATSRSGFTNPIAAALSASAAPAPPPLLARPGDVLAVRLERAGQGGSVSDLPGDHVSPYSGI